MFWLPSDYSCTLSKVVYDNRSPSSVTTVNSDSKWETASSVFPDWWCLVQSTEYQIAQYAAVERYLFVLVWGFFVCFVFSLACISVCLSVDWLEIIFFLIHIFHNVWGVYCFLARLSNSSINKRLLSLLSPLMLEGWTPHVCSIRHWVIALCSSQAGTKRHHSTWISF